MARGDLQVTNPANRWFKWSGSTGTLSYYDKEANENVGVATPFTFLLIETYTTIRGYDESAKKAIYSNEVKDTTKQILNVKSDGETIASGLYKDIKATVVSRGGGYAQSCYIAYKNEDGNLTIGNIMMSGSSFGGGIHKPADKNMKDIEIGGWLSFTKKYANELYSKAVVLEGKDDRICTNGNVKFYAPKFKLVDVTKETDDQAIALTQVVKKYMEEYFKITQAEATKKIQEEAVVKEQVNEALKAAFGDVPEDLFMQDEPPIDNSGAAIFPPKEEKPAVDIEDTELPF